MKFIIHAFALSLVITGAIASTHVNTNANANIQGKVSGLPTPTCPPTDPNGCNIWNPPPVAPSTSIQ